MRFLATLNHLSWKQVSLISLTSLLLATGTLANRALSTPTRTTSQAVFPKPTPSVPHYPLEPPTIDRLEPWFGKPGDTVRIRGTNFGTNQWGSLVTLNQLPCPILAWSNQAIDVTIPNTSSGSLSLTINQHALSLPLSIYHSSSDPHFDFIPESDGTVSLTVVNQPANTTLAYSLVAGQTTSVPFKNSLPTPLIRLPAPTKILFASLQDASGTYLPLYIPSEMLQ